MREDRSGVFHRSACGMVTIVLGSACCLGCGPQVITSDPFAAPPVYQVQPVPMGNATPSQASGTVSLTDLPQMPASSVVNLPKGETEQTYHEVQTGETLASIARKYSTTAAALRSANGLEGSSMIRPGQLLWIPKP